MTQPVNTIVLDGNILRIAWDGPPGFFIEALEFYGLNVSPDPSGEADYTIELADDLK